MSTVSMPHTVRVALGPRSYEISIGRGLELPLPPGVDARRVLEAADPDKDVDGFHPLNVGRLVENRPGPRPCTPAGIMELLRHYGIPVAGPTCR